jgi:hypothetical protein
MALPLIFSLLGSGLAGAGALGTGLLASPLIAGAIGSGLGTAAQTGDLGKGIQSGLTAGLLGGLGGALMGGAGGAAPGILGGQAAQTGAQAMGQGVQQAAAQGGIRGLMANMPSGLSAPTTSASAALAAAKQAGTAAPLAFRDLARQGLNQGVLSGAGIGTALPGVMDAMKPRPFPEQERKDIPEAEPFRRERNVRPAGYRPGIDPEFMYFTPSNYGSTRFSGGGMVQYRPAGMSQPVYMQAGGIASMMPGAEMVDPAMMQPGMMPPEMGMSPEMMMQPDMMQQDMMQPEMAAGMPQMNEKAIVQGAIMAVKGELPEQQAAIVLGMFLETFGEEALRRLISDVQAGKADGERGDVEGMVQGPGDGMDDLVPAMMDDGSQDVLLSDGEFVVPADVVSGLGNGSTDAGAQELYGMMDRIREARTGMTEQPAQVRVGGLLPA